MGAKDVGGEAPSNDADGEAVTRLILSVRGFSAWYMVAMSYFVTVTISPEEWEEVLVELTPLIGQHVNTLDTLTPAELADVLRTVMKTALARHHRWLAERQIGTVISPVEDNERTFCFEFADKADAELFAQEFHGEFRGNCAPDSVAVTAVRIASVAMQEEGGGSLS